jgi:hypothetical protein
MYFGKFPINNADFRWWVHNKKTNRLVAVLGLLYSHHDDLIMLDISKIIWSVDN